MKKVIFYIVFIFTCFYFLSAGNMTFFSKLGKVEQTELLDLDEDATDSEGKEAKDSKEDSCDEEVFLTLLHSSLLPQNEILNGTGFDDLHSGILNNILEKSSPPPKV